MITELRIENFAIIEKLTLRLEKGLVILTGETGAGKSIVLDAVELVLGGRADAGVIRSGADQAYIEATFRLEPAIQPAVHAVLEREALLDDPDYLTLAREIRANGRSVARVNGRTVNAGLLREIGEHLVDIHGQSEHLSLLNPRKHLPILDRYAQTENLLADYRQGYQQLQKIRRELQNLHQAQADAARRSELLAYQADEIENARLKPGEDEELKQERDRMANAETVSRLAQEAIALLDEGNVEAPAAADLIGQAVHALQQLNRYDPTRQAALDDLQAALETVSETARSLRDYLESVEYNPIRLEEIEERLDLIHRLKRKYGGSIEEILAYGARVRAELEQISSAEERIAALEAQEKDLLEQLARLAQQISEKRQQAAQSLSAGIERELDDLRMAQARFQVSFSTRPAPDGLPLSNGERVAFDASGYDQVEFLIAPNPGEGFKPLAKIASGGETSRLMLALKNVLAQADEVPTLIFDEIDQGIGGRIGLTVGQKLWQLARHHQVLCVTHLPQLAAFGGQHFHVEKQVQDGRTSTIIRRLDGEERLHELAQMLGSISETTLQSAQELLQTAQQNTR
jgi:DNA repair protein RecN (Recombination protein N)